MGQLTIETHGQPPVTPSVRTSLSIAEALNEDGVRMAENPWQHMIERGMCELIEKARSAVFEEDDGTKRWRMEKALVKPLWLGFEDG